MTVRLDAAARRKVERLAKREGLSLNEALNRLLRLAPDGADGPSPRRRYRLKPRKLGFGFEIARAKELAGEMEKDATLARLKTRR